MCEHSHQQQSGKLKVSRNLASTDPFTHLHLHSSYSLLDGAIRIPDLMTYLNKLGMKNVALTDHGNLFGAFEFYHAAKKANIKPILGCEFYVAPGKRQEKTNVEGVVDGSNYHLVILARNNQGYQNLMKLSSRSYIDGFYRKPRIDYELLEKHASGLICLSACIGGEIQNKIIQGRMKAATELAGRLKEIMDPDCFFLELQNHGLKEEKIAAEGNFQLSKELDIPLCLTNDSHYLEPHHQEAQEFLLRINQKKTIHDRLPFSFNPEFYVKSSQEMAQLFPDHPEAYLNTQRIAEMVDLDLNFSHPLLPDFQVPPDFTLNSYLYKLAKEGLERRFDSQKLNDKKLQERFEFEFNIIKKTGFAGYFLIVQDFTSYAKKNRIPIGPGRGSAAGSLISYSLGITDIDPLRHGLLFERFLNPNRNALPDIDIDFCTNGRETIIQYVKEKYGDDKVGQIITYSKMTSKSCLKDVARVLEIPFGEANSISDAFPQSCENIPQALQTSKDFAQLAQKSKYERLFRIAQDLEGNVRQVGIHAAGILIAPRSLEELTPLAMIRQKDNRVMVSQYDMDSLLKMGMVKIDFLGLQNLTIIGKALELIKERHGKEIKFRFGPDDQLDDAATYRMIRSGEVKGVFQLESRGMREFLLRLQPDCFEDLIALLALFRPGPLQSGMADSYINRKTGKEKVTYEHPILQKILQNTYGVILFQEQVMEIGKKIGGLTPLEGDQLRVSMGKKNVQLMNEMKEKFVRGAIAQEYSEKFAIKIYQQMEKFAGYGFNKSHSAAYACIVYQTAYLKTHFTIEYLETILNSSKDNIETLQPAIRDCSQYDIQVKGPDVNESMVDFAIIDNNSIRFGLSAIKNVGELFSKEIVAKRQSLPDRKFANLDDFFINLDLRLCNKRVLEALIKSGSLDSFTVKRKYLLENVEILVKLIQSRQRDMQSTQELFSFEAKSSAETQTIVDGIRAYTRNHTTMQEYPLRERLSMEKEALGLYLSGHPLGSYEKKLGNLKYPNLIDCAQFTDNVSVSLPGILTEISKKKTRSGNEMIFFTCEDLTATIEGIIFPRQYKLLKEKIKIDTPLWLEGKIKKEGNGEKNLLILAELSSLDSHLSQIRVEHALHIKFIEKIRQIQSKEVVNQLKEILIEQSLVRPLAVTVKNLEEKNSNNHMQTKIGEKSIEPYQIYFHLPHLTIKAQQNLKIRYDEVLLEKLKTIESISQIYLSIGNQVDKKYEKPHEKSL